MPHFRSTSNHFFFSCRDVDAELPANFQDLDEGTPGLIRDLLHQRNEALCDLDRAQTDQVVIHGQISNADTKVESKSS